MPWPVDMARPVPAPRRSHPSPGSKVVPKRAAMRPGAVVLRRQRDRPGVIEGASVPSCGRLECVGEPANGISGGVGCSLYMW
jgi:hypothetical protein